MSSERLPSGGRNLEAAEMGASLRVDWRQLDYHLRGGQYHRLLQTRQAICRRRREKLLRLHLSLSPQHIPPLVVRLVEFSFRLFRTQHLRTDPNVPPCAARGGHCTSQPATVRMNSMRLGAFTIQAKKLLNQECNFRVLSLFKSKERVINEHSNRMDAAQARLQTETTPPTRIPTLLRLSFILHETCSHKRR